MFPYRLLFPDLSSRLPPALWDTTIPPGGHSASQDTAPGSGARWLGKTASWVSGGTLVIAGYGTLEVPDAGWPQGPCYVVIAEEKNGRWHARSRHKFPVQWWTDAALAQTDSRDGRLFFLATLQWHKPSPRVTEPVTDAFLFEWTGKRLMVRFSKRLSTPKGLSVLRLATRPWVKGFPVLSLTRPQQGDTEFSWNGKSYTAPSTPLKVLRTPAR